MTKKENIILGKYLRKKYRFIWKKMKVIGVTGTNGKSTTTTLVYKYLRYCNYNVTLIGTNGVWINDKHFETNNTTPGIKELYEISYKSYLENVRYIIMEVSSHGIDQERIKYIPFSICLLTNVTLDHLDYHKTYLNYKKTKLKYLKLRKLGKKVLLNGDMNDLKFFSKRIDNKIFLYGLKGSKYQIIDPKIDKNGINFKFIVKKGKNINNINKINNINNIIIDIHSNLLGLFNIYNICSFLSIIDCLKLLDENKVKNFLSNDIIIDGRMNEINWQNRKIIIDFAHTPDGVEQVLKFLKQIKENRIITVIGCGGLRDKSKRPIIGNITSLLSDITFFTSDNPRTEDPNEIINDMINGVNKDLINKIIIEIDRKKAIEKAIKISEENDIIAILGRGNEKYQKINNQNIPFDDYQIVKEILKL